MELEQDFLDLATKSYAVLRKLCQKEIEALLRGIEWQSLRTADPTPAHDLCSVNPGWVDVTKGPRDLLFNSATYAYGHKCSLSQGLSSEMKLTGEKCYKRY